MGLLTMKGMPGWHPANEVKGMVEVTERVKEYVNGEGGKLEDLAVRFGMRDGEGEERVPVVVGCADLDQVRVCYGILWECDLWILQSED